MSYPSAVVANWFIERSCEQNIEVSPMKLQKLLYYAHGAYLATYGEPLLDENIEVWPYGPVIASVYRAAKKYGNNQISEPLKVSFLNRSLDKKAIEILRLIWNELSIYTGIQLANMTHTEGAPWDQAKRLNQAIIDNKIIQDYFNGSWKQSAA